MDIVEALGAESGLTCVVGAGGKKTTLYSLAPRIERAVVTATVRIPIFDSRMAAVHVTDDPVSAIESADGWPVGLVPEREGDRYLGYDPEVVHTTADCHLEMLEDEGPTITRIDLETEVDVPGIGDAEFQELATTAKETCPVSRALTGVEITLEASR